MLINRPRAMAVMEEHNLDGLVASSLPNVIYVTDMDPGPLYNWRQGAISLDFFGVLPKREGTRPTLIAPRIALSVVADADEPPDAQSYGVFPVSGPFTSEPAGIDVKIASLLRTAKNSPDAEEALVSCIEGLGLADGRLGIDETQINSTLWERLRARLPKASIKPAAGLFREIRMVKSPEEVERLAASSAVAQAAIVDTVRILEQGVTEQQLATRVLESIASRGAFPGLPVVSIGTRSSVVLPPSPEARLHTGDLVRFDVGCVLRCYWSDLGRTPVFGKPSEKQRECYKAVYAAHDTALQHVRAGARVSEIYDKAIHAARTNGIPHFERHHCGHSIGLELYDSFRIAPVAANGRDVVLEENMVFSLETPYHEVGFGGIQAEDTVCVTQTGCRYLTTIPKGFDLS